MKVLEVHCLRSGQGLQSSRYWLCQLKKNNKTVVMPMQLTRECAAFEFCIPLLISGLVPAKQPSADREVSH